VGTLGSLMWGVPLAAAHPLLGMMNAVALALPDQSAGHQSAARQLLEREVDFDLPCAHAKASVGPRCLCAPPMCARGAAKFSRAHACQRRCGDGLGLPAAAVQGRVRSRASVLGWRLLRQPGAASADLPDRRASDILLVQINPIRAPCAARHGAEIMERMNEVTFNASLLAELRAIEFVRRLLAEGKLDPRRYKRRAHAPH
jgi:NTE family protein